MTAPIDAPDRRRAHARATCSTPMPCGARGRRVRRRLSPRRACTATPARDAALMQAVNVDGHAHRARRRARAAAGAASSTPARARPAVRSPAARRPSATCRRRASSRVPYKRTKLDGERLALEAAAGGRRRRRRQPDGAGRSRRSAARPRPARWSPTSPQGRARGYLARQRAQHRRGRGRRRRARCSRSSTVAPASGTCSAARTCRCATCSP